MGHFRRATALLGTCLSLSTSAAAEVDAASGDPIWDLTSLSEVPAHHWLDSESPIRSLIYQGGHYQDAPTEVFAFYASPATLEGNTTDAGKNAFPGVVLIHGGGGTAFAEWVELWAKRGYAAIAMDLSGHRPPAPRFDPQTRALELPDRGRNRQDRVRLARGGPDQGHPEKFESIGGEVSDDWPWHAVSNVIRAHSLLRHFPEVDSDRTAVTGISWGGYTTCLVASVDDRFQAAVPVYGCGFLYEGESVQKKSIDALDPDRRELWIRRYDPSSHLPRCRVPIFFVNGTHDVHYPLDSYQKSYELVPGEKRIRIEPKMRHSHPAGWAPEEIGRFIDHHCGRSAPLAKVGIPVPRGDTSLAFPILNEIKLSRATLHYTTEAGLRSKRTWLAQEAAIEDQTVVTPLPPADANTWFLELIDETGSMITTPVFFTPPTEAAP